MINRLGVFLKMYAFLLAVFLSFEITQSLNITMAKLSNSTIILMYNEQTARIVPDEETVAELGFQFDALSVISDTKFKSLEFIDPIYTLKKYAVNPDEIMRVLVQKALIMNPMTVTRLHSTQGFFNPAIALYKDRIMLCYGVPNFPPTNHPHASDLRFAWFDTTVTNRGTDNTNYTTWTLSTEDYLGIGSQTYIENKNASFVQDGRISPLSDGTLLVTYSTVHTGGGVLFHEMIGTVNGDDNKLTFSNAVQLGGINEKNWIPIEFNNTVYYVQNLNPLHIVKPIYDLISASGTSSTTTATTATAAATPAESATTTEITSAAATNASGSRNSLRGTNISDEHNSEEKHKSTIPPLLKNPVIKTVFKADSRSILPWRPEYGNNILRGSFGTTLIRDVYLTFFHTKVYTQPGVNRFTYFMGAVTMCPHLPFHLHTMSTHPILLPTMYDGPWLWNSADYIVYPTGLILINNNTEIILSVGLQNKEMQILKLSVDELFDSMEPISECNNKE